MILDKEFPKLLQDRHRVYLEWIMLRSMPPGECMDKGKGYDDMISCATCSLS